MDVSTGVVLLMVAGVVCVFWVLQRRGSSPHGTAAPRYRGSHDDGDVVLWSAAAGSAGAAVYSDAHGVDGCDAPAGDGDDAGSCDSGGDSGGGDGGGGD